MTDGIECGCSHDTCSYDDFENPEIYKTKTPVARTQHRCCECGCAIEPGDRYQYIKALYSCSGWSTYKTCAPCAAIRRDYGQCSCIGDLWQEIVECLGVTMDGENDDEEEE